MYGQGHNADPLEELMKVGGYGSSAMQMRGGMANPGIGAMGGGATEKQIGHLLQKMMPEMPGDPGQIGMGGQGILAKGNVNWTFNRARRYKTVPSLRSFLMKYSIGGSQNTGTMDPKDLLKL